jgi:hypothetical protein
MSEIKTRINGYAVTRIFPRGYLSVTCSHCGDNLKSDGTVKDLRSFVANHCTKKGNS